MVISPMTSCQNGPEIAIALEYPFVNSMPPMIYPGILVMNCPEMNHMKTKERQ